MFAEHFPLTKVCHDGDGSELGVQTAARKVGVTPPVLGWEAERPCCPVWPGSSQHQALEQEGRWLLLGTPKVGFPFCSPPQPVNLPLCCSARDLWEREQSWSGRYPSGSTQVGWERWSSLVCRLSHGGPALPAELAGLNIHSLVRSACHT